MFKFHNPRLRFVTEPGGDAGGATPPAAPAPTPTPTPAPSPTPTPAASTPAAGTPTHLPDDHPLVKAFNAQKAELTDAKKRLSDIDEAQKTDAQKQADKITALENENTSLKADKLRAEVAKAKSDPAKGIYVPAELLSGSTKAELEAAADALLAFKGTPGSPLGGNQRPAGPVSQVQEHEETREDRRKRLAENLQR